VLYIGCLWEFLLPKQRNSLKLETTAINYFTTNNMLMNNIAPLSIKAVKKTAPCRTHVAGFQWKILNYLKQGLLRLQIPQKWEGTSLIIGFVPLQLPYSILNPHGMYATLAKTIFWNYNIRRWALWSRWWCESVVGVSLFSDIWTKWFLT